LDSSLKIKYFDLSSLIKHEFNRNVERYGEKINCRKGCSQCCSQIFNITLIDSQIISDHVKSIPQVQKDILRSKAIKYIEEKKHGISLIPCPALGSEGECTIYEVRPIICRRFGMPIYDYKKPDSIYACELNFKTGEEIEDDELIPRQTEIGIKWDNIKTEYLEKYGNGNDNKTTIAEAILKGF
jgi:Fe-S-cluster containining protein